MNTIAPTALSCAENGGIPNNPTLPVLIYRGVFDSRTADKHRHFQQVFERNGWRGIWKNGLYDYHHFHARSHEALGFASGSAEIEIGGEGGRSIAVQEGDLIVLPAGTGHKRLSSSGNLVVIGAYPAGQEDYDICRNTNDCPGDVVALIAAVTLPQSDPVYGSEGPLIRMWR